MALCFCYRLELLCVWKTISLRAGVFVTFTYELQLICLFFCQGAGLLSPTSQNVNNSNSRNQASAHANELEILISSADPPSTTSAIDTLHSLLLGNGEDDLNGSGHLLAEAAAKTGLMDVDPSNTPGSTPHLSVNSDSNLCNLDYVQLSADFRPLLDPGGVPKIPMAPEPLGSTQENAAFFSNDPTNLAELWNPWPVGVELFASGFPFLPTIESILLYNCLHFFTRDCPVWSVASEPCARVRVPFGLFLCNCSFETLCVSFAPEARLCSAARLFRFYLGSSDRPYSVLLFCFQKRSFVSMLKLHRFARTVGTGLATPMMAVSPLV